MIEIIPYQERWPAEFQAISSKLRNSLGGLAIRIDHIGSTSVPGLAAKDVIDIQVTVASLDSQIKEAMSRTVYIHSPTVSHDHRPANLNSTQSEWEKWFFKEPEGKRKTNIHVRVKNRNNQRYPILFRDFLRTHPSVAGSYAELKRRLVENLADPDTYPDVKDPAVDLIYFAAEEWAKMVNWRPRESDA